MKKVTIVKNSKSVLEPTQVKKPETPHDKHWSMFRKLFSNGVKGFLKENDRIFQISFIGEDDLYSEFILKKMSKEDRQVFNCNSCRKFFNDFVLISAVNENKIKYFIDGMIVDSKRCGVFHQALKDIRSQLNNIKSTKVRECFYDNLEFGSLSNEEMDYHHFHTAFSADEFYNHSWVTKNVHEKQVDVMTRYQLLTGVVEWVIKFPKKILSYVDEYIRRGLIKGDKDNLLFQLKGLSEIMAFHIESWCRDNPCERVIKTMCYSHSFSDAVLHSKNSVIGKLIENLYTGMRPEDAIKIANGMLDPMTHLRPTTIKEGNVQAGDKFIKENGYENSFRRRVAEYADIENMLVWTPSTKQTKQQTGLFSDKILKKESKQTYSETMSMNKFLKRVNTIKTIQLKIQQSFGNPFVGLLTQVLSSDKPILAWDRPEENKKNPISWYLYTGGSRPSSFNIQLGWVNVKGLMGNPGNFHGIKHAHNRDFGIFILENCKDLNKQIPLGLFPDILKSEFRPYRSTIERYCNETFVINNPFNKQVAGIMFDGRQSLTLRVTYHSGDVQEITLNSLD